MHAKYEAQWEEKFMSTIMQHNSLTLLYERERERERERSSMKL